MVEEASDNPEGLGALNSRKTLCFLSGTSRKSRNVHRFSYEALDLRNYISTLDLK